MFFMCVCVINFIFKILVVFEYSWYVWDFVNGWIIMFFKFGLGWVVIWFFWFFGLLGIFINEFIKFFVLVLGIVKLCDE